MGTSDDLVFKDCEAATVRNMLQFSHSVMEHNAEECNPLLNSNNRQGCEAFCGGCNWAGAPAAPEARARASRCPSVCRSAQTACSAWGVPAGDHREHGRSNPGSSLGSWESPT